MKEDFDITLSEQNLCDLLNQRFDFVQDFQEAEMTLSAENFYIFSSQIATTNSSFERFVLLLEYADIQPVLNEFNQKMYWLLKSKPE